MEALVISINDAAQAIGIGRTKIYELINAKKLETIYIGRRQLVKVASMRRLVDENG